jgi:hypothetical protein
MKSARLVRLTAAQSLSRAGSGAPASVGIGSAENRNIAISTRFYTQDITFS